jgi:uncharacterized protein
LTAYVLSLYQTAPILAAGQQGQREVITSLDLGRTTAAVALGPEGVRLPDHSLLSWADVETMAGNENACYQVQEGQIWKIQIFSEQLNRLYSLMPTSGRPTMLVSGIPMHRIKDVDPEQDTKNKIKTIAPVTGRVLDTATGLGYTAIMAAQKAEQVVTIELDPTVLEIARLNPWSQELFSRPNIEQRLGDASDVIETLADDSFSRIIHDPPTFSLAGQLYSLIFYRELRRVLKRKGRLFHYVGDPRSKSGSAITRGVVRRLGEAGFERVVAKPRAFGVVAYK